MPRVRQPRADGVRTRNAILREAVSLATVYGLEGLSIGNLAAALDMSKSGVYAHFDSKEELQLATVDEASRVFHAEVIEPALAAPEGVPQMVALCDAFCAHLARRTFPGGCFLAGAILEMGTHPGPVRERVVSFQGELVSLIHRFAATARARGQLAADDDLDQLVFDLNGIILAANSSFVLSQNPAVLDVARRAVRRRLRVDQGS